MYYVCRIYIRGKKSKSHRASQNIHETYSYTFLKGNLGLTCADFVSAHNENNKNTEEKRVPNEQMMSSSDLAWQPLPPLYECVCEWVNVTSVVKHLEQSVGWKSTVEIKKSPSKI